MDGISPSICPTGIYRPPSRKLASSDALARPPVPPHDPLRIVRALKRLCAIVRRALGGLSARSP